MNTWQDIITMADTTFRNTFNESTKVTWLSSVLSQILQLKFSRDTSFAFMDILKGIQDYDLPEDCEPEDILTLQLETSTDSEIYTDYYYKDVKDLYKGGPYYTITNGMIHFGTRPSQDVLALIFYVGTPVIDKDDLTTGVPIPLAYRELLVHGLCERMAAARGDVTRKNNFKSDYDTLLVDYLMNQLNNVPEYTTPRDELPSKAGRRGTSGRDLETTQ